MDYACAALTAINKAERQKLEVIQNRCLRYARRAVDTCNSNNEPRSWYNFVNAEQGIIGLTDSWWSRASKNYDDIINPA